MTKVQHPNDHRLTGNCPRYSEQTMNKNPRSGPRLAGAVLVLMTVFAFLLCAPAGAALSADVQGSSLPSSLMEGAEVTYTVVITGIPSQAKTLELSTDLIPVAAGSLWTISTDGVATKDSLNERLIHLTASGSFPVSVTIDVNGRVPTISTTTTVDGVVVNKIPSQRSGYLYYDVKALDAQGKSLSAAATGILTITVADEVAFLERADALDDTAFRSLITGMYAKGLTAEAWDLLEWYEAKPAPIPIFVPIIVGVVALILGFGVGFIVRSRMVEVVEL